MMKNLPFRKILIFICIVVLLALVTRWALNEFGVLKPMPWAGPKTAPPMISTRGHFRNGKLVHGHGRLDYTVIGDIPGMAPGTEPADDLLIIIHGFNNEPEKAAYMVALARRSMVENGYEGAVAGLSWDADTQHDPWSTTGYYTGRRHAVGNGPKLAKFIADYKTACPGSRVHIMGYSMGARLALEVLWAFEKDPDLAATLWKVDSVHLAGAAVDNEEVELGMRYGSAIENRVGKFYNYYSFEDNILGVLFPIKEGDRALGEMDIEHKDLRPFNYVAVDAEKELYTFDSEGKPLIDELGNNHMNCLGYIDAEGNLLDDGVMDLVARAIRAMAEENIS
jgi:pimeloyl-ACP methyl ester carboxylesterase